MRLSQPTNTVALAPPLSRRYRFVEIHYRRPEETHKGRVVPARVETVVIFLPDVWSCSPTRLEWESMAAAYKKQLQDKLAADRTDLTHQAPSLLCAIYLSYYLYIYIYIYIHTIIYIVTVVIIIIILHFDAMFTAPLLPSVAVVSSFLWPRPPSSFL